LLELTAMPDGGPSMLSFVAAALYAVIVVACGIAAGVSRRLRQPSRHWRVWVSIALVFAALAAFRLTGIEDVLREALRDWLRADAAYAGRRAFQRPLAAAALGGISLLAAFMLWRDYRTVKGRRTTALLVAKGCALVMALLIVLRIVSLHQVDSLLYGPLKLNWVIDIGVSGLVLVSAALYIRLARQRP
jgi:hypothetical protein